MRVSPSSKSTVIVVGLAVALAAMVFFSLRFVPRETVRGVSGAESTSVPALSTTSLDENIPGKTAGSAEQPPDRTIKELVRTWNQGKAEDIAGLFLSEGTLVFPTGSELRSRAEIAKTISEKHAGALKETTLSNTVEKVSRPDPETAVVQGTYKLDGIKIMGFSTTATGSYVLRQIKREGRWLISRAEVTKGKNG
jgi:uncharacterized protein (TIGR02246 family)